jgi:hypothetical protein
MDKGNIDDTQKIPYVDVRTSMRSPRRKRREERGLDAQLQPVVILAALGGLCIIGLIMLAFAPGHSVTIETTLANGVVASVAAIAGLVRPGSGAGR